MKPAGTRHEQGGALITGWVFWSALVLMLWAPLFRGSNRYAVLAVVEIWALATILLMGLWWIYRCASGQPLGLKVWALSGLMVSPMVIGLLQIGLSSSQVQAATWLAMLAVLPMVVMAGVALIVSGNQLRLLVQCLFVVALLQVLVSFFQLGGWDAWYFDSFSQSGVIGTFGNRNHLANLLVMVLPLLLWEMQQMAEHSATQRHSRRRERGIGARWLWVSALLLVLAGLLATLSRTGIFLGALVILLFLLTDSSVSKSHWLRISPLAWAMGAALGLALLAGGWEWLARFDTDKLMSDDALRAINRAATWEAVQAFWPMGSGLGTFEAVFPRFQDASLGAYFINHAHNEYLQLLMEGGAWVLPPAVALLWLIGRRVVQLWRVRRENGKAWSREDALSVACGLGFLAQALHAWVDYPWSIPATAMVGAFLLGVFLREPSGHALARQAP